MHVSSELYFANLIFTLDIINDLFRWYTMTSTDRGARPDVRFCPAVCARDHMNLIGHPFNI